MYSLYIIFSFMLQWCLIPSSILPIPFSCILEEINGSSLFLWLRLLLLDALRQLRWCGCSASMLKLREPPRKNHSKMEAYLGYLCTPKAIQNEGILGPKNIWYMGHPTSKKPRCWGFYGKHKFPKIDVAGMVFFSNGWVVSMSFDEANSPAFTCT